MMRETFLAMFFVAASTAWAQDNEKSDADEIDSVDLRISVIENIDVTAEKAPAVSVDELEAEIESILDEVEALEDNEESE